MLAYSITYYSFLLKSSFDLLKNGFNVEKDDFSHMDGSLAKRFKRETFDVEAILDYMVLQKNLHLIMFVIL